MKTATIASRLTSRSALRARTTKTKRGALQIRNILVPIDFSAASLEAVKRALPLIEQFGASLHLAHVFAPDYPLATMAAMPLIVPEVEVTKRVRRHLRDVAKKYSIELRPDDIHAIKGRPFEEICRVARECDINLIVMATRGNTGLKHLALGSTAERVVRYSPCPVLVVHAADRKKVAGARAEARTGGVGFGKILVPIDFSECSMRGVVYAKALAEKFRSKLVLLHSVAIQYYVTSDEYARYDFPLLMRHAEKAARKQLGDLVEKNDWDGVTEVESSLQIGHAGQQICARALEHEAEMIVMSTHGTTGLKHVLLGSTAEYVVRHASCPVLVVPSHERPVLPQTKKG